MSTESCKFCSGSIECPDGGTLVCTSCGIVQGNILSQLQDLQPITTTNSSQPTDSERLSRKYKIFLAETNQKLHVMKLPESIKRIIITRLKQICKLKNIQSGKGANSFACAVTYITVKEFRIAKSLEEILCCFELPAKHITNYITQTQSIGRFNTELPKLTSYLPLILEDYKAKIPLIDYQELVKITAAVVEQFGQFDIPKTCSASSAAACVLVAYSSILKSTIKPAQIHHIADLLRVSPNRITDRVNDLNRNLRKLAMETELDESKRKSYHDCLGQVLTRNHSIE